MIEQTELLKSILLELQLLNSKLDKTIIRAKETRDVVAEIYDKEWDKEYCSSIKIPMENHIIVQLKDAI